MNTENSKGLFTQQKEFIQKTNNEETIAPLAQTSVTSTTTSMSPSTNTAPGPQRSRHSPPASRPESLSGNLHPELDGIESLTEIKRSRRWAEFVSWLRAQEAEGEDEEGRPLSLERYAKFSELFTSLETRHSQQPGTQAVREAFLEIVNHEEKFFGKYRCLKCVDSGLRAAIMKEAKDVKVGTKCPSLEILMVINQRVEDRLSELLATYQNYVISKTAETSKKSSKALI